MVHIKQASAHIGTSTHRGARLLVMLRRMATDNGGIMAECAEIAGNLSNNLQVKIQYSICIEKAPMCRCVPMRVLYGPFSRKNPERDIFLTVQIQGSSLERHSLMVYSLLTWLRQLYWTWL